MSLENKIDIKELFLSFQDEMKHSLRISRHHIGHPSSKGDASENEWIKWLAKYLPKRYKVDKAFLFDHEGTLSEQMDIVIYDQQYSPFVFHHNGTIYVPAESFMRCLKLNWNWIKEILNMQVGNCLCTRIEAHFCAYRTRWRQNR